MPVMGIDFTSAFMVFLLDFRAGLSVW